jgi:hypothetical protein
MPYAASAPESKTMTRIDNRGSPDDAAAFRRMLATAAQMPAHISANQPEMLMMFALEK